MSLSDDINNEMVNGDTIKPVRFGKGFIADPLKRIMHGPALALTRSASGTTPNCLSRMSSVIGDQKSAGSCVAWALSKACLDRMLIQRTLNAKLSAPLMRYAYARIWGLMQKWNMSAREIVSQINAGKIAFYDTGCMIPDAVDSAITMGICAEEHCPYSDALVLSPTLQPEAYKYAYDQRGHLTVHRCSDTPEQKERDIRASLTADFPIIDGQQVDDGFEKGPSGLWEMKGLTLGGHCMETVACDDEGVWKRNQWAEDWGIPLPTKFPVDWVDADGKMSAPPTGGFVHVSWNSVLDPAVSMDAYAVQFTSSFSEDNPLAGT